MNIHTLTRKSVALILGAMVGLAATTPAATVLQSDFAGVSLNSSTNTASSISWTTNGIVTPTTSMVFVGNDDKGGGELDFHNQDDQLPVDYNLSNEGSWSTSVTNISLEAPTTSIDLTNLSLDFLLRSNLGVPITSTRDLSITVGVFGSSSGSIGTGFLSQDRSGADFTNYNIDLSSLPDLNSSEIYTVEITVDTTYTRGQNASMDNLVLSGTVVPEPSIALLAGLGLSGLMVRRKRSV